MSSGFCRSLLIAAAFVLGALACEPSVQAQSAISTGTVGGQAEDTTGGFIPGVEVVLTNPNNGFRQVRLTDNEGLFSFSSVPTGVYVVEATAPGFRSLRMTEVNTSVGTTTTLNLKLDIGDVQQEILVTAQADVLNISDSSVSSILSAKIIQNLPTLRRQVNDFALLSPGVTVDGQFGGISFSGASGGGSGYGRVNSSNSYSVDGGNATSRNTGTERMGTRRPYLYGSESVEEFQITQSPYSPAYGGGIAGYVNTITKSGTNSFHGSAFYYNRHSATSALDAVSKAAGFAKAKDVRQQFGASVGGPIFKDKLFFFFDHEQQRRDNPITVYNGALSRVSVTDFGLPAGTVLPKPNGFPLPSNLTAPDANNPIYLQQASNALNQIVGGLGFAPRRQDDLIFFERLDWMPSSKDMVALRYNFNTFLTPGEFTSNPIPDTAIQSYNTVHNTDHDVLLRWTHAFSPSMMLSTHSWFNRDQQTTIPTKNLPEGFPGVRLTVPSRFNIGGSMPIDFREYEFGFSGHVTWIKGRHTLDFGSDINHDKNTSLSYAGYNGMYTYTNLTQFALGQFNQYTQNSGNPLRRISFPTYQFYIGDTFKVNRKLTLNLGFRQDWQVYPQPPLNPALPLTGLYNNDYNRWAPRFGFAYNPLSRTVIRGGIGVFRAFLTSSNYLASTTVNGLPSLRSSLNVNFNTALAPNAQALIFPNVLPPNSPLFAASSNVDVIDPGLKTPYATQASLQVEQQLTNALTVTVGSIFVHSTHLISQTNYDLNLRQPTGTTQYVVCPDGTAVVPCAGTNSVTLRNLDSRMLQQGARFPGFGQVRALVSPGNSNYNAGFIEFRQSATKGLTGTLTYTVSRNVVSNGYYFADQFDFSNTKSPSMLDQRHRIVAGVVYSSSARNRLLANWMLSTSINYGSGRPYAGVLAAACVGTTFSTCTGGSTLNDSAFNYAQGINGAGPSPNIGLHSYVGPWTQDVDINLERGFRIGEFGKLMLRATAFNAFNSPNYLVMSGLGLNGQQYLPIGPTCGDRVTQNQTCYLVPNSRPGGFGTQNVVQQNIGPRFFQFTAIFRF
jgi:hypothetical protein